MTIAHGEKSASRVRLASLNYLVETENPGLYATENILDNLREKLALAVLLISFGQ